MKGTRSRVRNVRAFRYFGLNALASPLLGLEVKIYQMDVINARYIGCQ
jgi:hypothetical protein